MFGISIESGDPKELNVEADLIDDCNICKTLALLGKFGSGRRTLANQIARRLQIIIPKLKIEVFHALGVIPSDLMSAIIILPDLVKSLYTDKHTDNII